jgi:hypothetical protein
MKSETTRVQPAPAIAELLVLSDGRILAHHLTPELARLLRELNPTDGVMNQRAAAPESHVNHTVH